jgi:hypothetical protein
MVCSKSRTWKAMKFVIFLVLIALCFVFAGRNPALFSDAENYAEYIELINYGVNVNAEPSFYLIVRWVGSLGLYGVFFVYLVLGFLLKSTYFLLKMPGGSHLILLYLTNYFVIHDLVQIRVGAALGLTLWAIHNLGKRNIFIALFLLMSAFFLHFSLAVLAFFSIIVFAVDNKIIKGLTIFHLGCAFLFVSCILIPLVFLFELSFLGILSNTFDLSEIIPERYLQNYLVSGDLIGISKILYSFVLAVIAMYALYQGLLLTFVARYSAVSLIFALFVLIVFWDISVIGTRIADTFLFFAPLMIFGLYATKPILGRATFFFLLTIHIINLAFFSTVIRL